MTIKNKLLGGGLGTLITHCLACPIHSPLPAILNGTVGSSAILNEYKILKPFAWLHEQQVHGTDYVLQQINPQEIHQHTMRELRLNTEHVHNHDHLHPFTETTVSGTNYLLMTMSVLYLGKAIYNKFKGSKK